MNNEQFADPLNTTREAENQNDFDIYFDCTIMSQPNLRRIYCKAGEFCHIPHAYYTVSSVKKEDRERPIKIGWRFGDQRKTPCPYVVRRDQGVTESGILIPSN